MCSDSAEPVVLISVMLIRIVWHGKLGRAYNRNRRIYCRFHPSCSHYAILALEKHGFFRGWSLAVRRIRRCVPEKHGFVHRFSLSSCPFPGYSDFNSSLNRFFVSYFCILINPGVIMPRSG